MSPNPSEAAPKNGRTTEGSTRAMDDMTQSWMSFYQRMGEESSDMLRRSMEMSQTMMPFAPNAEVIRQWTESSQEFFRRMGEESRLYSKDPATATRRMYDLWLQTWTENLEHYLRTPEFAAKSGRDLEMFADLKKRFGQFMEAYWATLHLPSAADMREIYQKLTTVDRKLDELDRLLNDLARKQPQSGNPG